MKQNDQNPPNPAEDLARILVNVLLRHFTADRALTREEKT